MKINELFKDEYLGKKVKDNSEEKNEWIISQTTLLKCMSVEKNIKNYYTLKQLLELEFEFVEEEKPEWERVENDEKYFFADSYNGIYNTTEFADKSDYELYNTLNYLIAEEKAKKVAELQYELRKTLNFLDTQVEKEEARVIKRDLMKTIKFLREHGKINIR